MNEYVDSLTDWDDFKETLNLTEDEREEINLRVKIIGEIINAGCDKETIQHALEEFDRTTDLDLITISKLLKPLGKTLQVVDLPKTVEK
ncbi:MAG: transcriptional regulator [Oscillospiraceae bacterium]|nr:transcriptional regulator [Oscillospiraceae bacterium]